MAGDFEGLEAAEKLSALKKVKARSEDRTDVIARALVCNASSILLVHAFIKENKSNSGVLRTTYFCCCSVVCFGGRCRVFHSTGARGRGVPQAHAAVSGAGAGDSAGSRRLSPVPRGANGL